MEHLSRQKQKQFLYASESIEFHLFSEILNEYGETEVCDNYGNTPLILAARNGNTRTVKALLNAGANIHARNADAENALVLASREAHPRMVSLLLEHGALCGPGSIGNRLALIKLKPEESSVFRIRDSGDPDCFPWRSMSGPSALRIKRIRKLMCKVVELLITAGADVNIHDKSNNSPLFNFIRCGEFYECIPYLVRHTRDLNSLNCMGETALTEAISSQKEDIALLLLESGADPNAGEWAKPIHLVASAHLSPNFLKALIIAGADVNILDKYGMTPLYCAFRRWRDNREITQILLDAGCDTNLEDGNGFTITDHAMMAALDLEDGRKYSTHKCPDDFEPYKFPFDSRHARFIRAAKDGDSDELRYHLKSQIPDRIKTLALFETLVQRKYECCQLLLDNGADPNSIGIDGIRALIVASAELEADITGLLHSYGAELELDNCWGQRPLFLACQGGIGEFPEDMPAQRRLRTATLLLGRGAEVNGADNDGWTPLRQAVLASQDLDLVRLLLQQGAKSDQKDKSGTTPLQIAEQYCSDAMVTLLRNHLKS